MLSNLLVAAVLAGARELCADRNMDRDAGRNMTDQRARMKWSCCDQEVNMWDEMVGSKVECLTYANLMHIKREAGRPWQLGLGRSPGVESCLRRNR